MVSAIADDSIVQLREAVSGDDLAALGVNLGRDFPGHKLSDLRRYPVLSEGGWFIVIKNQQTLETICRQPWRRLGPITLLSEGLDLN